MSKARRLLHQLLYVVNRNTYRRRRCVCRRHAVAGRGCIKTPTAIRTNKEHHRQLFDVEGVPMLDDDGLPLDDVGPWAKEKHQRLRRYLDISRAARRKWVQGTGGATYVDLYCGTGRAIIRDTDEKVDGSPLVAFKCARDGGVPFSKIYIADAIAERCSAAEQRIISLGESPLTEVGPAEETARRIVKQLNPYGLHFAFLDPYNLQDLPFSASKRSVV